MFISPDFTLTAEFVEVETPTLFRRTSEVSQAIKLDPVHFNDLYLTESHKGHGLCNKLSEAI